MRKKKKKKLCNKKSPNRLDMIVLMLQRRIPPQLSPARSPRLKQPNRSQKGPPRPWPPPLRKWYENPWPCEKPPFPPWKNCMNGWPPPCWKGCPPDCAVGSFGSSPLSNRCRSSVKFIYPVSEGLKEKKRETRRIPGLDSTSYASLTAAIFSSEPPLSGCMTFAIFRLSNVQYQ